MIRHLPHALSDTRRGDSALDERRPRLDRFLSQRQEKPFFPVIVYRQGQKAWKRFGKPNLELRSAKEWLGVQIDRDQIVLGLGNDVQALSELLVSISRQRRRVQKAAAARRKAAQDFDRSYQLIGSSTETDYRMAGLDDEAERARPSRRRGGQGTDDEEPVELTVSESEVAAAESAAAVAESAAAAAESAAAAAEEAEGGSSHNPQSAS